MNRVGYWFLLFAWIAVFFIMTGFASEIVKSAYTVIMEKQNWHTMNYKNEQGFLIFCLFLSPVILGVFGCLFLSFESIWDGLW